MNQFNTRIKMKKDSEENWNQNNPILLNGEIALVEKQEGIELKIGNGEKQFKEVSYYFPPPLLLGQGISNKYDYYVL